MVGCVDGEGGAAGVRTRCAGVRPEPSRPRSCAAPAKSDVLSPLSLSLSARVSSGGVGVGVRALCAPRRRPKTCCSAAAGSTSSASAVAGPDRPLRLALGMLSATGRGDPIAVLARVARDE
eukprot:COSAG03_NODE_2009_length_3227_cov_4.238171_2_plen_121_part_00